MSLDRGADKDSLLKLYRSSSLTRALSSERLFQFKQPTQYADTAKAISDEPKRLAQQQKQKDKVDQKKRDNPYKFQANAVSTQKLLCRPHGSQHEAYSIIFASLGI
ncbi:hypothetical protein, partial [Kistimonas scapharcae]|uniref:hypothetical protein n=1 Tax=Kistimonas scapharcae TaxID=1036133 RepID=UPI0031E8CF3E